MLAVCFLAGCSMSLTGTRETASARELSVVSWNLEWLADPAALRRADFWARCRALGWPSDRLAPALPVCDAYRRHRIEDEAGYEARKLAPLRRALLGFAERRVDLIAVQEVQGAEALAAVLPAGYRAVCFTTRDDAQNIGFAVRSAAGLSSSCEEVDSLALEDDPAVRRPVRRGLSLRVRSAHRTLAVLAVHLKAGCVAGRMDNARNDACSVLQRQAAPLEKWIETQAADGIPFVLIGDFNRDLDDEVERRFPARTDGSDPATPIDAAKIRNLFPEINDRTPPASLLELARVDRSAAAAARCHRTLDHLVVSAMLRQRLASDSLAAGRLAARLVAGPAGASDHCALETVLRFR